jgi:uncharacterized membrane protein
MNRAHIHLLITHLPIFASMLGALVLAFGIWKKSEYTKIAAYLIFVLAALAGTVAYLTGEYAEEAVEHIDGVSKERIEEHEDAAAFAFGALLVTGVASLGGIYLTSRKSTSENLLALVVLAISVITFSIAARTGYLGGQIRHETEIHASADGG